MSEATLGKTTVTDPALYMALELSDATWRLAFGCRGGQLRERRVAAGDLAALRQESAAAKARFKLAPDVPVMSCYEAGRDGFWLHRALTADGIANLVVDSASIEVSRRARHRKTDKLDARKLLALLMRRAGGETRALRVVQVPSPAVEDERQLSRTIDRLKTEVARHVTRIKALLVKEGVRLAKVGGCDWAKQVAALRTWDGKPLGAMLRRDLVLEGERLVQATAQLEALKAERNQQVASAEAGTTAYKARQLMRLGGIAHESSFVFATELFGWRRFANRRQLAGAVGLTPTPYASGANAREQGISKAGNRRLRRMLVEIAWCWLRHQPQSALARWWQARFGAGTPRQRRIGIVALARKLLVALWQWLETGLVPEDARLKPEVVAKAAKGRSR